MAASGEHIAAMVRSHAAGDDATFYSVAMQVAAREARAGHHKLAENIKAIVEASRQSPSRSNVTKLRQPRGELAELVHTSHPEVSLRDLTLPAELTARLKRIIGEQRQRKALAEHGLAPAHRLLLEGPPGTGKTMTASALAHELSSPLHTVRLDSLMSKYMGETAAKLRSVFDGIATHRGVYLFDEFDALGADRAGNDVGEARRVLNSFLVFLENSSSDSLIVAATNHRALLDRALFRRFDAILRYQLPAPTEAMQIMRRRLGTLGKSIAWKNVSALAEGLSQADVVHAAEDAAKTVIMAGRTRVSTDDMVTAIEARRSTHGD